MNISDAVGKYIVYQEAGGFSMPHRKESKRILKDMLRCVGDRLLTEVTTDHLLSYISAVRLRPGKKGRDQVTVSTVAAYHRTLDAFFHQCERTLGLHPNPMKGVPKPEVDEQVIRPFDEEHLSKLLTQPDTSTFVGLRDVTTMSFLLDSGCRISEALGITFNDIDLESGKAVIRGKGKKERVAFFGPSTREWLKLYLERRSQSAATNLLFVNQDGKRLTANAMSHRVAAYGNKAGIRNVRVSPHTFRHTFGAMYIEGSGDYKGDTITLMRLLGHSTPTMAQKYANLSNGSLQNLHSRLSPGRLVPPPPSTPRRLR